MSEERTQAPSKLRRQQARERGQAAHSSELTGAAGLLAVVVLVGFWGDDLVISLLDVLRAPLRDVPLSADAGMVVDRLRGAALGVAWPLGAIVLGGALAALVVHQVQVGGLWVPGLLAPNPARLWVLGRGPDLAARGWRGIWALLKALLVVLVTAWVLRSAWADLQGLGALETPRLARAAGAVLQHVALMLAASVLTLGLIDYALQYNRFESLLRLTPEEEREDMRAMEGDPALRARRRRAARAWRGDAPELLGGASLLVAGSAGLTVVLGGGPPPRRWRIVAVLQGPNGARLRRAAESAGVPLREAPGLARRLARHPAALPVSAGLAAELAPLLPPGPSAAA
jgi:flagellar biosynthetic protein FlhB